MAEVKQYQHIFFDLDHTLWDFDTNSRLALRQLFKKHNLQEVLKTGEEIFLQTYYKVNDEKWKLYRQGIINKDQLRRERVRDTLRHFSFEDDEFSFNFDREYLEISPFQTALLPNTISTLRYLQARYHLHIITNGFVEVQHLKLKHSKLHDYFTHIITSEMVGVNKPHPRIFEYSLEISGGNCENSLMIGDNLEADIIGARNCGIDQVFFNPAGLPHSENVHLEIQDLAELKTIL